MMSREERDRYLKGQDDIDRRAGRWILIGLLVPGFTVIGVVLWSILSWVVSHWPIRV